MGFPVVDGTPLLTVIDVRQFFRSFKFLHNSCQIKINTDTWATWLLIRNKYYRATKCKMEVEMLRKIFQPLFKINTQVCFKCFPYYIRPIVYFTILVIVCFSILIFRRCIALKAEPFLDLFWPRRYINFIFSVWRNLSKNYTSHISIT